MKSCQTVSHWLDAMVDGDLRPEEQALTEEHLRACATCRADLEGLRAVKREAASLPRELAPPHDLWHGIEGRLDLRSKSRQWLNPAVVAAAATVVAAIALAFLLAPNRGPLPATDREVVQVSFVPVSSSSASVETFRAEYQQARTDLLAVIEARRHQFDPDTLEVIERNMRIIDDAINDIELALATNPNGDNLDRQMKLAYQQQINLLRWAARLSA